MSCCFISLERPSISLLLIASDCTTHRAEIKWLEIVEKGILLTSDSSVDEGGSGPIKSSSSSGEFKVHLHGNRVTWQPDLFGLVQTVCVLVEQDL